MIRLTAATVLEWRLSLKKKKREREHPRCFHSKRQVWCSKLRDPGTCGSTARRPREAEMGRLARRCVSWGRAQAVPSLSRAKGGGGSASPENC